MNTTPVVPPTARPPSGPSMDNVDILTWADLETQEFPYRPWMVDPILKARQVAMIYAQTGVGKTWFTVSLAVTAASGSGAGFLGFNGAGQGVKTLIIDGEMDVEDLQHRIDLIVQAVGADQQRVRENLMIASRQHQQFGRNFPDIANEGWQTEVLRYCQDQGIKLVILDNFSTLASSIEDENSSAKIGKVNTMLLMAKQAEVTCVLVHHANKTNGSYRGSSNIAVTLDLIMALNRPDNYSPVEGETAFTVEFEKVRGVISQAVTNARTIVFKTTPHGATWKEDDHPATQGHLIKAKLESLRFTTQKELAQHLDMKEPTLSRKINQAIAAGIFKETDLKEWLRKAKEIREAGEETTTTITAGDDHDGENVVDPTMF